MYLPRSFVQPDPTKLAEVIAQYPLATLITRTEDRIDVSPVPMLYEDGFLRGHVARANPVWREHSADAEVVCVFQGGDAYITPSWYATKRESGEVVPTWNYRLVEARGPLRVMHDHDWLRALVTRLTERFEDRRVQPWAVSDAPPEFIDSLLGAIVGLEVRVTSLVGKWKVSQNRSSNDADGVERGLRERAEGHDVALADAMLARESRS